jgi:hypothetical protein
MTKTLIGVGGVPPMLVKAVRVGVHGLHYARVAEQRLHHLWGLAALEQAVPNVWRRLWKVSP